MTAVRKLSSEYASIKALFGLRAFTRSPEWRPADQTCCQTHQRMEFKSERYYRTWQSLFLTSESKVIAKALWKPLWTPRWFVGCFRQSLSFLWTNLVGSWRGWSFHWRFLRLTLFLLIAPPSSCLAHRFDLCNCRWLGHSFCPLVSGLGFLWTNLLNSALSA